MTNPVKIVRPITIDDSILTSTNVAEEPPTYWNGATAYDVDDEVSLAANHSIYKRLVAGTTATSPELDLVNWIYKAPTNPYKMFDGSNSTQTINASSIEVTVTPGTIANTLALFNMVGQSVDLTVTDPIDGVIVDTTIDLQSPPSESNWYSYFYDTIRYKRDLVIDLPSYVNQVVDVAITAPSGDVKCGTMLIGSAYLVGDGIQYGASVGIQDYSRKEQNQFGDYTLVERNFAKRASFSIWLDNSEVDYTAELLADLRATPTLYVGTSQFSSTAVFGFYKDFDISIAYEENSICSLQVEGLT